jgi:hypothetical protein
MKNPGGCYSTTAVITMFVSAVTPQLSVADEGGVSFWLPGTFGSLAAVPGQTGWSFATFGYNLHVGHLRAN